MLKVMGETVHGLFSVLIQQGKISRKTYFYFYLTLELGHKFGQKSGKLNNNNFKNFDYSKNKFKVTITS